MAQINKPTYVRVWVCYYMRNFTRGRYSDSILLSVGIKIKKKIKKKGKRSYIFANEINLILSVDVRTKSSFKFVWLYVCYLG